MRAIQDIVPKVKLKDGIIAGRIEEEQINDKVENDSTLYTVVRQNGEVEVVLSSANDEDGLGILYDDEIFVADTAATTHVTFSKNGARNERKCDIVSVGHMREGVVSTSIVDIPGQFENKDGEIGLTAELTEVRYDEKYNFNLFSLSKIMRNGWSLRGNTNGITATKNDRTIRFDIIVRTSKGQLYACRFRRRREVNAISAGKVRKEVKMNIEQAHSLLGHINEDATRRTAHQLGWTLTRGSSKPCEYCAQAKAKQKNVNKRSNHPKETKPGGRVYVDQTKVTVPLSDGTEAKITRKYWTAMVDEATGKKWHWFGKTKKEMVEPICQFMNRMKAKGIPIRIIRMDPGGENERLKKRIESVEWQTLQPVDIEFTSRDTPQHNSRAETSFPYIAGLARASLGAANIPTDVRGKICLEAISHAIQVDGLVAVTVNGKTASRDEHVYGKLPNWTQNMHTFGEMAVVKEKKNKKLGDRGTKMMFVGYPENREADSYRMWNPLTNGIVTTRDVIWMDRMFYAEALEENEYLEIPIHVSNQAEAVDEDSVGGEASIGSAIDDDAQKDDTDVSQSSESDDREGKITETSEIRTRTGRVVQPRKRLIETMNLSGDVSSAELHYLASMLELESEELEIMCVGAGIGGGYQNTTELHVLNYKQAMKSSKAPEWRKEVVKEHERFKKYKVFTVVKRSDMPKGAKAMSTTWAFKHKANGDLRGRLNLRGFEQVDGIHYESSTVSSPVTNATSIRIILTLMAMNPEWVAEIVDVEGAFLQGEFTEGEEIYIEVPQGFEEYYNDDDVLKLNVPLYGMKQAASCFYKKLVKAVKKRNYERSKADPCLYFTWKDGRRVVMLIWIDDNLIVENPCDVAQVKVDWKSTFECKDEGELKEYIGSKTDVVRRDEGTSIKSTQPVLVQSLEDEFDVPSGRAPRAPAPAGQVLKRNDRSNFLERCRRNQIQKWGSQNGVYAAVVTAGYLQFDKRSC